VIAWLSSRPCGRTSPCRKAKYSGSRPRPTCSVRLAPPPTHAIFARRAPATRTKVAGAEAAAGRAICGGARRCALASFSCEELPAGVIYRGSAVADVARRSVCLSLFWPDLAQRGLRAPSTSGTRAGTGKSVADQRRSWAGRSRWRPRLCGRVLDRRLGAAADRRWWAELSRRLAGQAGRGPGAGPGAECQHGAGDRLRVAAR